MSSSAPVAGWYPDPDSAANDRWWDGAAWSEHRRLHAAAPASAAAPTAAPTAAYAAAPASAAPYAPASPYATGYAPVIATQPPKNTIAVAGLIVGICSIPLILVGFSFFAVIGGVTAGLLSGAGLTRAKRLEASGGQSSRRTIAIVGLVVGYGGAAVALVWTILSIVQFFGNF